MPKGEGVAGCSGTGVPGDTGIGVAVGTGVGVTMIGVAVGIGVGVGVGVGNGVGVGVGVGIGVGVAGWSVGAAETVSFGEPQSGEIGLPNESDQWTFDGVAGQDVVIQLQHAANSRLDTVVELLALEEAAVDHGNMAVVPEQLHLRQQEMQVNLVVLDMVSQAETEALTLAEELEVELETK